MLAACDRDRLEPRVDAERAQQVANVVPYGLSAQVELLRDLRRRPSLLEQAQDLGLRPLRYGNTSPWYYDNRDDHRGYPTNGFFPGNFSADPRTSWLGIAGALAGNSERSVYPYPSQVVIGPTPHQPACLRLRSYDPASGT